ncbi:hypothetical protein [Alkalimarinus alittae]|uniref:Uncharacterized protein n=1 Tax=Alkalimarinus alittae TaxID=2961619 RepID=A0ABY6N596_9ALTE|nr:hypothetical protein [Alkalimarinus alittae]UZE97303.1 hypothetical protein NKI27_06000 [Alkalimarinus alittae]
MPNIIKFILLAIPVLSIGIFMSYRDFDEVERIAFDGRVSFIEWESRNHDIPLIEVSRNNGTKVKFSSRIVTGHFQTLLH